MLKQNMKTSYIWWTLGALVVIALLFSGKFLNPAPTPATSAEAASILTVVPDDHIKGNPNATVTLIEYLDFECEACGAYYPVIKQLGAEFPNDLRIVTRYFPLAGHRNSMTAAIAVEAASRQGKYWEMHDILFENQQKWGNKQMPTPQVFEQYAQQIGLNMSTFRADVADQTTKDRVQRDFDASEKLGNDSTPSLFLDGKKIQNPGSYEEFKQLIATQLAAAKSE